jgi:UDP-N-acetylmuramate: L-alanyl-gamma-D-glutamyl-meso-diaminopimelate ligase
MLAWILHHAGLEPGFLIGGVPENFGVSARLGAAPFFVVEADEYDSAFFDKRSKFVHYRPRTLILNNLEYDHADIFPDLAAIQQQFHHLVRTVPGQGLLVTAREDANLAAVLTRGCWTPVEYFDGGGATWTASAASDDGSVFDVYCDGGSCGRLRWGLLGRHNVHNALAAVAAARHAGVPPEHALAALAEFRGVKRRMQVRGQVDGVTVYDDFAHHPTAISTTLEGLRARVGSARIIAVLEPRSNTMRLGVHRAQLAPALSVADRVFLFRPADLGWDLGEVAGALGANASVLDELEALVAVLTTSAAAGDHIVIMSNGGFGGIHAKLLAALRARRPAPGLTDAR